MSIYKQILGLRQHNDQVAQKYCFSALIREILPWSKRPPILPLNPNDSNGAIFQWNDITFLVEAQTAREITVDSQEWKIFRQKLEHRQGIGLFFSLYTVHRNVIEDAQQLIAQKKFYKLIILQGEIWDELQEVDLEFEKLIQYLVCVITEQFSVPYSIQEIEDRITGRETTVRKVRELARQYSATFLRRYRNPQHSQIYVQRYADDRIVQFANKLRPSRLLLTKSNEKAQIIPEQICLIRDLSGSGKTTLAIEIAFSKHKFFGISQSALESDIDAINTFLKQLTSQDYPDSQTNSLGIPALIYQELKEALIGCGAFYNDDSLNSIFIDHRLFAWHNKIPQAQNPTQRVEKVIEFLYGQYSNFYGNALVALLKVLSERAEEGDNSRTKLRNLANQLILENIVLNKDNCQGNREIQENYSNDYGLQMLIDANKTDSICYRLS